MATNKKASKYTNGTYDSTQKQSRKSLAQNSWEAKVKAIFNRILLERKNINISNTCLTKRFPCSLADFNTIEIINKEIAGLDPIHTKSLSSIAKVLQAAQLAYEQLKIIKKEKIANMN
ncbi:MAG: hypothetical protein MHPSP_002138 [Paramarteilia canceri]